jgi:rRNA processing protein Gar1
VKSPLVYKKIKSFDSAPSTMQQGDVVHYMMPVTVIGSEEAVGQIMSLIGPAATPHVSINSSLQQQQQQHAQHPGLVISETLLKVRPFVQTPHSKFFAPFLLRNPGLIIFTSPEDVNKYA